MRTKERLKIKDQKLKIETKIGFTLIELLLVIIIFGMILASVVPLSIKSFRSLQLTDAARRIVVVMKYARNRAVIEKKNYKIDFDIKNSAYSLSTAEVKDSEDFKIIKSSLFSRKKLPNSLKIESLIIKQKNSVSREGDSIYLYPDGSMDEAELILINSLNEKISIETMLSGRINVVEE